MPRGHGRPARLPGRPLPSAVAGCALALSLPALLAHAEPVSAARLDGRVMSGARPLGPMPVTLYRTSSHGRPAALGSATTGPGGRFEISYRTAPGSGAVLYLIAGRGAAVRLASVLGPAPTAPRRVVVNERTTVATGFALAQFVAGRSVAGPAPGPQNAAAMARNLVDPRTGRVSRVLQASPNGRSTSTWRTFDSLANMLVPCVRTASRCAQLLRLARPPGGSAPHGTLDAVAGIARNPGHNVAPLFRLARSGPAPYRPALGAAQRPDAWTLAVRFHGDGKSMDGPGNAAIDAGGNVWVTNNYVFHTNPLVPACGSDLLLKFTPDGRYAPGSPYAGGGLNGAGFGITLDPRGNVWVGNFGFAGTGCMSQPPHNSVSKFSPAGTPLSPNATASSSGGFSQGSLSWPQGTVSDRRGNIWIANCGNDTVTRYSGGDPDAFQSLGGLGIDKPFDIAFNLRGQAFVTGNGNAAVAMLDGDGTPTSRSPITGGGLDKPMGIAGDSRGNMWVSNSAAIDVPCSGGSTGTTPAGGSLTLIGADGTLLSRRAFTGGGLTIPWGITVDGDDNVWVANFDGKRLSQFCGTRPTNCPPGTRTGQAISPRGTGYGFDGLVRNTGVEVDPSGNVWVTNNWKTVPPDTNPGGYQMVAFIGLAGPLRTPVIGPPRPLRPR